MILLKFFKKNKKMLINQNCVLKCNAGEPLCFLRLRILLSFLRGAPAPDSSDGAPAPDIFFQAAPTSAHLPGPALVY